MRTWFLGRHDGFDFPFRRTESIAGRRVQRRVHELLHGEGYVVGGKRSSIRKAQSIAQLESDRLSAVRNLPRGSEFGLELLRHPVYANQHAASQVADGF